MIISGAGQQSLRRHRHSHAGPDHDLLPDRAPLLSDPVCAGIVLDALRWMDSASDA
jgi:hypothetical protein